MSLAIRESWFVRDMIKITTDMWLKGWDERNGGNVSLRLSEDDIAPFQSELTGECLFQIGEAIPELGGQLFLVTGAGKYFRNVQLVPSDTLGLVRVADDGSSVRVLWGFSGEGSPTSELSAHLKSHRSRQAVTNGAGRVIVHCHATNLIALSHVLDLSAATLTRALWEMCTECITVFSEGIGVLPWMLPGTPEISEATAMAMQRHSLVLWPFHGVFAAGPSLDEAFGLIDTAEKAAGILIKVLSMGGQKQAISTDDLKALAARYHLDPMPEALALETWMP